MKTCYFSVLFISLCLKVGYIDAHLKDGFLIQVFSGSLSNELDILYATERPTHISAALSCTSQCEGERRCIGFEICKIQESLYQCRAFCSWKKLGKEKSNKNLDDCAYFQLVNNERKGYINGRKGKMKTVSHYVVVALGKPTSMSSTLRENYESRYAVDGVRVCPLGWRHLAHSKYQHNPWLKIDLQQTFDILSVTIYARQDCCEPGRLKNVMVTVSDDGENHTCGFYPGPTNVHDRISVLCEYLARGHFVTVALHLEPGTTTVLHVCEVQVYGKLLALL